MLKNNPIFLMFLLVLVSQLLCCKTDSLIIPISPDLEEYGKLDNGLHLITCNKINNAPVQTSLSCAWLSRTGSVMEDDQTELGLAHFLEHMAFRMALKSI